MDRTIQISDGKSLKLTNVLIREIDFNSEGSFDALVLQMENYLKSKGVSPVGPLIEKAVGSISDSGEHEFRIFLMRQASGFVHGIDKPYSMESVLRVRNCFYAHYVGPEENLSLAFDKINVTAFESGVELFDENYTVFVGQKDTNIIADVFIQKKIE